MIRTGITLISLLFAAHAQTVIPELVQSFPIPSDPVHLPAPTPVQLLIDPAGNVTAIETMLSVPDEAVSSLRRWKFNPGMRNGKPDRFLIEVVLNLRRPPEYFISAGIESSLGGPRELGEQISAGMELTWDKTVAMDRKLGNGSKDFGERVKVLVAAALQPGKEAREIHARQLSWVVTNDPLHPILGTRYARISTIGAPFSDPAGFDKVRQVWSAKLAAEGKIAAVAVHAALFFELAEPEEAERLLTAQLQRVALAPVWMGSMYARSLLDVGGIDAKSGDPQFGGSTAGSFREHAKTAIETAQDRRFLMGALFATKDIVRYYHARSQVPESVMTICESLVRRIKGLGGEIDDCGSADYAPVDPAAKGEVQAAKLIEQPVGRYPPQAFEQRLQGKVQFRAIIGKDGRIRDLELRRGGLIFYDDARAAVTRWKYRPPTHNGEPAEVITAIDVNYTITK